MKARITLDMELTDTAHRSLNRAQLLDVLDDTGQAIVERLFGSGFLPADVYCVDYDIKKELID